MDAETALKNGYDYYNGRNGMPLDKAKGFAFFGEAAAAGNAEANYVMGSLFEEGAIVPKDMAKAIAYYETAYQGGNLQASAELGDCYYKGKGVPVDINKAYSYYRAGAYAGHGGCAFMTGFIDMEIYKKHFYEAYKCFQFSIKKGFQVAESHHNLGLICQNRIDKDLGAEEALKHFKIAADMGFAMSMDAYAMLMFSKNHNTCGIEYLETAVRMGYQPAMTHLQILKDDDSRRFKEFLTHL